MYGSKRSLALVAAVLIPGGATAQDWDDNWHREVSNYGATLGGQLVDVQVEVAGLPVALFTAPRVGDPRRYFEARQGRNYSLVLTNRTGQRIGVMVAVDGLNVVDGQRSSLSPHEAMYILDPWERTTIRGWRTSLDQVRRFVFVDEQRSYAARTGQANGDLGWIRVLTFRERTPWFARRRDGWSRRESLPPPAAEREEDSQSKPEAPETLQKGQADKDVSAAPGTGWGERRYDPVHETEFTADGAAVDHLILRYEYAHGLAALGIDTRRLLARERWRERDGEFGFALPPRW